MSKRIGIMLLILSASCGFLVPTPATEQEKDQAIANAVFDGILISDISRYDALKTFLITYSDTIISYRNSRNDVITIDRNRRDTARETNDCYNFFQGNKNYDISNVPDFLKLQLDSLYHAIGTTRIKSFTVCRNNQITIQVRSAGGTNGLYISHNLIWNNKRENHPTFLRHKDTLVNGDWLYRIGVDEHHGH